MRRNTSALPLFETMGGALGHRVLGSPLNPLLKDLDIRPLALFGRGGPSTVGWVGDPRSAEQVYIQPSGRCAHWPRADRTRSFAEHPRALRLKMAQKPYILLSLGPKASKNKFLEP